MRPYPIGCREDLTKMEGQPVSMTRVSRKWLFVFLTGLWMILFLKIQPARTASAHPADMYAQSQSVQITRDGLSIDWKITPGPMLAGTLWDQVDQKHNGVITQAESQTWIGPILTQWSVQMNGQPMAVHLVNIRWPDSLVALQASEQPIEVQLMAAWPAGSFPGKGLLDMQNSFNPNLSLYWFSVKSDPGYFFDPPVQNNGQLRLNLTFNNTGSNKSVSELNTWESGKPSLPGITGAVTDLAGNLANAALGQVKISNQANPVAALLELVGTQSFTPWFLLSALLLSVALGGLHALTPGHGKALVAAYLVGSRGKTRDAIFLGSVVTLTHTGSVLILGLVTLIASRYILAAQITPWLEIISGLLVVLFGVSLLVRRGRELYAWTVSQRTERLAKHFGSGQTDLRPIAGQTEKKAGNYLYTRTQHVAAPLHFHSTTAHDAHPHTHAQLAGKITWKSLLALGISGGLVPCPDAIAILLVAVALNRIPFGMLLIVAFSLGLALVLIAIGIALVQGARFIGRNDFLNRFSVYAPLVSAGVVLVLGVSLSLGAGYNLIAISPSSANQLPLQSINLAKARLVYLSPDRNNNDQVFVLPLNSMKPQQLTQEPEGVEDYSLSPDRQLILYTTMSTTGAASIWSINRNGLQKKLVLNCPQAQCGGPVWSPDGKELVYERHDYDQQAAVTSTGTISTIWWLDLKTGETKPVFRDQAFPGFSPRFSPDGRWLSFVSPANNAIQIYALHDNSSISVPQPANVPEVWSPDSSSILYWRNISTDISPGAVPFLHLQRFVLASGKVIDLGGSSSQEDYSAGWSPDGRWIAVLRGTMSNYNSSEQDQVWLMRPDGSQGHALPDDAGASYGDLRWTSDSQSLLFDRYTRTSKGVGDIWLANIYSGKQTELLSGGIQPELLP